MRHDEFKTIRLHFEAKLRNLNTGRLEWLHIGQSDNNFRTIMYTRPAVVTRMFMKHSNIYDRDNLTGSGFVESPMSAVSAYAMCNRWATKNWPDVIGFCDESQTAAILENALSVFCDRYNKSWLDERAHLSMDMLGCDIHDYQYVEHRIVWFGYDADPVRDDDGLWAKCLRDTVGLA